MRATHICQAHCKMTCYARQVSIYLYTKYSTHALAGSCACVLPHVSSPCCTRSCCCCRRHHSQLQLQRSILLGARVWPAVCSSHEAVQLGRCMLIQHVPAGTGVNNEGTTRVSICISRSHVHSGLRGTHAAGGGCWDGVQVCVLHAASTTMLDSVTRIASTCQQHGIWGDMQCSTNGP
jgi:hypothetical protein